MADKQPPTDPNNPATTDAAINMIREKLEAIYGNGGPGQQPPTDAITPLVPSHTESNRAADAQVLPRRESPMQNYSMTEPAAREQMDAVEHLRAPRSIHQQFMYNLHNSGKTTAEIQTAWHQYYLGLSDDAKRQVWNEFNRNTPRSAAPQHQPQRPVAPVVARPINRERIYPVPAGLTPVPNKKPNQAAVYTVEEPLAAADSRNHTTDAIRRQIRDRVRSRGGRGKLKTKHHIQSLIFGLGFGLLVILVVLFSFFNEVVIAPFIQPSRTVSATPIIVSTDGLTATGKNEVLIPKINLEIPLDFTAKTVNEKDIEAGLDNGVAHYPTTVLPGQLGNAAFFGHSSNNIFNPGKYKFAFVLLHELEPGDTFYITYNNVAYAYQVYDKKVVEANQVSVLNNVEGKPATVTLITCDPPGTSLHRLVVWGQQVSPDPSGNAAANAAAEPAKEQGLPGNGPTLWGRFTNSIGL